MADPISQMLHGDAAREGPVSVCIGGSAGKIGDWLWRIPFGQVVQSLPSVRLSDCGSRDLFLAEASLHMFGDELTTPLSS